MTNSADPDQLANWSGSTLFAKAGYIAVQQDNALKITEFKFGYYFAFVFKLLFMFCISKNIAISNAPINI